LSKFNYNLTAMYEKGPWSVRVAYDWRSTYLLVSSGANGTHTLPVFSRPYGQMDFGASYKIDDHFTIGVDGQNILNTVTKTVMGVKYDRADPAIGNQQYGRNWFMSDRRVIGSIRFAF
jgi:outer membrane receptor protein involved in Fe transport